MNVQFLLLMYMEVFLKENCLIVDSHKKGNIMNFY